MALHPLHGGHNFDADSHRALTQWLPLRDMPVPLGGLAPEPGHFEQPGSPYFRDCAAVARIHADAELLREATIAAESTFEETIHEKALA